MGKAKRKGDFKKPRSGEDLEKRRKESEDKWRNTRGDRRDWTAVKNNKRFEAYYKAQGFITPGEDWDLFMDCLKRELPACFRINSDCAFADDLREEVMSFVKDKLEYDGAMVDAVQPLTWYPQQFGFRLGTDRKAIRKTAGLSELHNWLKLHTDNGNITRQEAVSMVPPLALDVEPHHKVFDVCAAPGSKTSQLLEIINKSLTTDHPLGGEGLVVANDADTKRAYMLVKQCRRLNSPLLIVTTHNGQQFPALFDEKEQPILFDRILCDVPCAGDGTMRKNPLIWERWNTNMAVGMHSLQLIITKRALQLLKPGGLLVYSTCSMSPIEDEAVVAEILRLHPDMELIDGRQLMLKAHNYNPEKHFKARPGLSSWHVLDDFRISKAEADAKRQAKFAQRHEENDTKRNKSETDVNGNEMSVTVDETEVAVATPQVAMDVVDSSAETALPAVGANLDLIPASLVHLRASVEMGMDYYPSAESLSEEQRRRFKPSMFPPTADEASNMHLERCLRCVPQDEDSGGFFVAVLRKRESKPPMFSSSSAPTTTIVAEKLEAKAPAEENESPPPIADAAPTNDGTVARKPFKNKQGGGGSGSVTYHEWSRELFASERDFYDMRLPSMVYSSVVSPEEVESLNCFFYIRDDPTAGKNNGSSNRTVYIIPPAARSVVAMGSRGLKIVSAGVKVFERRDKSEGSDGRSFRLLQEGISTFSGLCHARRIHVTVADFSHLCQGGGLIGHNTLSAETMRQLMAIPSGPVLCVYDYRPEDVLDGHVVNAERQHRFEMVCWRGSGRLLNVMCNKIDMQQMIHQLKAIKVLRTKIVTEVEKMELNATKAEEVAENEADEDDDDEEVGKEDGGEEDEDQN